MTTHYFEHPAISASFLKEFIKSPQKAITEKKISTEALTFGSVFHQMMEGVKDFYVYNTDNRPEPDKNFNSKLNKQWKQDIYDSNELVITFDEWNHIQAMTAAIKGSNFYKNLSSVPYEGAEKEYYTELPNGEAKCKPDALYHGKDGSLICVDWKTTNESLTNNEGHIKRIMNKFGYGIQAVHYTEVLKQVTGKDVRFFFVFVEKNAPFDFLPVYINPELEYYNYWFEIWNDAMLRASESKRTGIYPNLEQITNNNYLEI